MTQAIFGLVGVIIGGLLTGGLQYATALRAERRDRTVAARVVASELLMNYAHLAAAVQARRSGALARNQRRRYDELELQLARTLPGSDVRLVSSAYLALEMAGMVRDRTKTEERLARGDWNTLVTALNGVRRAIDALNRHTDIPAEGEDIRIPLGPYTEADSSAGSTFGETP